MIVLFITASLKVNAVIQTILNILDRAFARGFRALVSLIHNDEATVLPEDLRLLTKQQ